MSSQRQHALEEKGEIEKLFARALFMYRAIVNSTCRGFFRFDLSASISKFFLYARIVAGFLPLPSRCRRRF